MSWSESDVLPQNRQACNTICNACLVSCLIGGFGLIIYMRTYKELRLFFGRWSFFQDGCENSCEFMRDPWYLKIWNTFFNSNFAPVIHVRKTNDTIPDRFSWNSDYFLDVDLFFKMGVKIHVSSWDLMRPPWYLHYLKFEMLSLTINSLPWFT